MYKIVAISVFLLVYLALLFLPNLPFVQYYYVQSKLQNEEQNPTTDDSGILIGDICYLKALMERTKQAADSNKDKTLPEPNNASNSLVYLINDPSKFSNACNSQDIKFPNHMELLTYRYLQVPSPPPKILS